MEAGDLPVQCATGERLEGSRFHNGLSDTLLVLLVPKLPLDYKMLLTHRMVAMAAGGGQSVLFLTPP